MLANNSKMFLNLAGITNVSSNKIGRNRNTNTVELNNIYSDGSIDFILVKEFMDFVAKGKHEHVAHYIK